MPCLPCGGPPSEAKLLARCYPPKGQSGSQPLKEELRELVVRLRETGQVSKVVSELEKRVQKDTAKNGDASTRISLLISLSILRTLTREFRTEIPSFAKSLIRILNLSLDYGTTQPDLDCLSRSVSVFIAFSNHSSGTDIRSSTQSFSTYLLVTKKLAGLATWTPNSEKSEAGLKNRMRAYGLSGVYGAVNSSLLLDQTDSEEKDGDKDFGKQVRVILPPLLSTIMKCDIHTLKLESAHVENNLSGDRRAPSIRGYSTDEKAPDASTVLRLALKSLYDLVSQCQTAQLSSLIDALFEHLDRAGWQDEEMCCWIVGRLTSGAMLQYRYVIPTRLVELSVGMGDIAPGPKQTTILAMIMTVINSDISLVGLGVIYILDSLVGLTIRRIRCHAQDALLPQLVECISSLATHIYYPEQVNEIVEEIAYRLPDIPSSDTSRIHIVRTLIYCIIGVMEVAQRGDDLEQRLNGGGKPTADKGKGPQIQSDRPMYKRSKRRAAISPEVFQETLPLLCESTYAVRAAYARALILYITQELPREETDQVGLGNNGAYRFCNALHATVYTLAMSCSLGTGSPVASPIKQSPSASTTPLPVAEVDPKSPTPPDLDRVDKEIVKQVNKDKDHLDNRNRSDSKPEKGVSFNVTEPTPLDTPTGTSTPPRKSSRASRRVSLPLKRMTSFANIESFDNVATPYDFAAILKILEELHKAVPVAAMVAGVPMLLALDTDAGNELIRRPGDGRSGAWVLERKRAIRETVVFTWKKIGQLWNLGQVHDLATTTLDGMPEPWLVPSYQPLPEPSPLPPLDSACQFPPHEIEGESSSASRPLIDRDTLLLILARSPVIQRRSGRDEIGLINRLGSSWSVENALKNSTERTSILLDNDGNYQPSNSYSNLQFLRPQSRVVDVNDLRLALDGRQSTNTSRAPSLRSSSFRSPSRSQLHLNGSINPSDRPKSRLSSPNGMGGGGAKDVLKDIFQNRHKSQEGTRREAGTESGAGPAIVPDVRVA